MPDIAPFQGLRFDPKRLNPAAAIAPPYDVIDAEMHARLLAHDPYNVVRWTLGDDPAKPYGTEEEYRPRAAIVKDWVQRGVLIRDSKPAFYSYEMSFTAPGGQRSRYRGILVAVEVVPWSAKKILPHEEIRPKVVDDRLNLLRATRVNMGVVQLTIDGRDGRMGRLVDTAPRVPLFAGDDFLGQHHRLEAIDDARAVGQLQELVGPLQAIVADGHHRYTTAIKYREETKDSIGSERALVMIGDLFQPGLQIYPTHRVLVAEDAERAHALSEHLRECLSDRDGDAWTIEWSSGESVSVKSSPDLAHDTLYRRLQGALAGQTVTVETYHDARAAEQSLRAHGQRALLCRMPAVGKDEFWGRAANGEIFPPKTTFFLPKIFTGIVARSLDAELA
ncbi:MAG: DUF1015 domain-containing protein [Planctomycetota bacterium]